MLKQKSRLFVCSIAFAMIAGGLITGYSYIASTVGSLGTDRDLSLPQSLLSFGPVWESRHFDLSLPITNKGVAPVEVLDIKASCACVSLSPRAFKLAPG